MVFSRSLSRAVVLRQRPIYDDGESTRQYRDLSFDTYHDSSVLNFKPAQSDLSVTLLKHIQDVEKPASLCQLC